MSIGNTGDISTWYGVQIRPARLDEPRMVSLALPEALVSITVVDILKTHFYKLARASSRRLRVMRKVK